MTREDPRFSIFFWYGTYRRARKFTYALTECLTREKRSTSGHGAGASYQTSHPGIPARAIDLGRSWPFAAFRYRPSPRYGIEGGKCRPLNHMRQIPLLLTAPDRPCQVSVRFQLLSYSPEKSFFLSYGKHWSRRLQSARTGIAKCNIRRSLGAGLLQWREHSPSANVAQDRFPDSTPYVG